jgi:hypothetical protein
MDFKRSKPMPPAPFKDHNNATTHKPARYSVQRIESAKQKALTGQAWDVVRSNMKGVDWTADDEGELRTLVDQWDESTGHQGLNDLIDNHEFSHGRHADNCNLASMTLDDVNYQHLGAGTVLWRKS